MRFPAEAVPDGSAALPHHFYTGLLVVVVGVLVALFGFALTWDPYERTGALLSLAGLLLVLLGLLVAADDWISHALGWPTPLDRLWSAWLRDVVS